MVEHSLETSAAQLDQSFHRLDKRIASTADLCRSVEHKHATAHETSEQSKQFLTDRRNLRPGRVNPERRSELSKAINKSIRRDLQKRHEQIIGRILEELVGL